MFDAVIIRMLSFRRKRGQKILLANRQWTYFLINELRDVLS